MWACLVNITHLFDNYQPKYSLHNEAKTIPNYGYKINNLDGYCRNVAMRVAVL